MTEKTKTAKPRGRKPLNGHTAKTDAQRKQSQRERQLTRINEQQPSEWTKAECLLVLSTPSLKGLAAKWALPRLIELLGGDVTITKEGYNVTFPDKENSLPGA